MTQPDDWEARSKAAESLARFYDRRAVTQSDPFAKAKDQDSAKWWHEKARDWKPEDDDESARTSQDH